MQGRPPSNADTVKDLHADLIRKWRRHGPTVEAYWRSFDKRQRTKCLKEGGGPLKHPMDRSLGDAYKFIPEWNLRDLTEPGDRLIDMMRYRVSTGLLEQYRGTDDVPGDYHFIDEMMRKRGLRLAESYKNCWTFFVGEDDYGTSYEFNHPQAEAGFEQAIRHKAIIPQDTGELILARQMYMLQPMNIVIEDILEEGSKSRARKEPPKAPIDAASAALTKLNIRERPAKLSFPELIASARDQKASLDGYLGLLSSEPVVLAYDVNFWFFSRPELVPDEKGRSLPQHTDRYIGGSFFDAIHNAVKGAAIWTYLNRLLERLDGHGKDKVQRAITLQEISNMCHLEYARAQALFKRQVQTGSGFKLFKRMSNAVDAVGNPRVTLKGKAEDFLRSDPQLHCILRLCHPDTNATKAVDFIKKLSELHQAHPAEREKLTEREAKSLSDLAVIVAFIQDLSPAVSMPPLSRKKGQLFVSRAQELEAELNHLKRDLDVGDYAVPIDNLLEPGMAEGALRTLDAFVVKRSGTKLGFLYEDLVEDCLSDLDAQYDQVKAKMHKGEDWTPLPIPTSEPPEKLVEQRKAKQKTRPSHSSAYEIAPASPATEPATPAQTFKVSASTAAVFQALFNKSESRRPVSWAAFESAMADLGFSVLPKYGSVYTFFPPDSMTIKKPLTMHRPHKSQIEGFSSLIYAQRLQRTYGWGEETFEVA